MNLQDILIPDVFPHKSRIGLGGGLALEVQYPGARPGDADKVRAFLKARLAELGFDGEVAYRVLVKGAEPTGEDAARFVEAAQALGDDADEKLLRAVALADGHALSLRLGAWAVVDGKGVVTALDDAIGAETCADRRPKSGARFCNSPTTPRSRRGRRIF